MPEEMPTPHRPMTAEQYSRVKSLTATDIENIDDALAMHITERFQKAAKIIGLAMEDSRLCIGIPDIFYFERLKLFAERGVVELIGYSGNMRFCELRLKLISFDQIKNTKDT